MFGREESLSWGNFPADSESAIFSDLDKKRMKTAIADAEAMTSGEIRVEVILSCNGDDSRKYALREFYRTGMHETADKIGVLVLVAVNDRKVEIVADKGINEKVPQSEWDSIILGMLQWCREGNLSEAIVHGVSEIGKKLEHNFPRKAGDTDELPNDIILGGGE